MLSQTPRPGTPARIAPYPTGRLFWGGTVPGTSCQATLAPSLRDISQQALARNRIPYSSPTCTDQIGLDTIAEIVGHWAETLNDDAGRSRVEYLKTWTAQGFLGVKSSRGFYRYPSPAYAAPGFLSGGKVSSNISG